MASTFTNLIITGVTHFTNAIFRTIGDFDVFVRIVTCYTREHIPQLLIMLHHAFINKHKSKPRPQIIKARLMTAS